MAHIEHQLISKIIRTGKLSEVLDWGITEDDFKTSEGGLIFRHIKGFSMVHGSVMGPHLLRDEHPTFTLCDDEHVTLNALCHMTRNNRIKQDIKDTIEEAARLYEHDVEATLDLLNVATQNLRNMTSKSSDQHLSGAGVDEFMDRLRLAQDGHAMGKISWPWAPLQNATLGIQPDDYVVFYGRPKSMKSFVLSALVAHVYMMGGRALVYTKEMPAWQLYRRIVAFMARLPYDDVRLGRLSAADMQIIHSLSAHIKERARETHGQHDITVISGKDVPGSDNIAWMRTKVEKYKPDVVFIDGLYLMSADGKRSMGKDHERVASISRAARQMVLETNTPLIATMQANRKAAQHTNAELDEVAYSDTIGQDATVVMRVINEKETPTIALVVGGSREFKLHGIRINAIPCINFDFREEMTEKDIDKAQKKDTSDKETESPENQVKKQKHKSAAQRAQDNRANTESLVDRAMVPS